jgi:formylglycine-generating enzyme required for sulfatase activity
VTVDQFAAFVAEEGPDKGIGCDWRKPGFQQTGSNPVVCVTWDDAKAYAAWVAKKTGKGYRLLNEAEWEYAARAGTTTRYFFGNEEKDICRYGIGFLSCNGCCWTSPAGHFAPNAFGLYDMHGNAWQWVEDCWHDTYAGAPTDGTAWTSDDCSHRARRGGSFSSGPRSLRSAVRSRTPTDNQNLNDGGFRLARTLTP